MSEYLLEVKDLCMRFGGLTALDDWYRDRSELSADLIAQHTLPVDVPVGIVTVVLGGIYLLTLLIQEARRRT